MLASFQREGKVGEQLLRVKCFGQPFYTEHVVAAFDAGL